MDKSICAGKTVYLLCTRFGWLFCLHAWQPFPVALPSSRDPWRTQPSRSVLSRSPQIRYASLQPFSAPKKVKPHSAKRFIRRASNRSGIVFTNLDLGTKSLNVDLVGNDNLVNFYRRPSGCSLGNRPTPGIFGCGLDGLGDADRAVNLNYLISA